MADKDPQLYARVRRESERKLKVAKAQREALVSLRLFHRGAITVDDLRSVAKGLVELEAK